MKQKQKTSSNTPFVRPVRWGGGGGNGLWKNVGFSKVATMQVSRGVYWSKEHILYVWFTVHEVLIKTEAIEYWD